MGYNVEYKNGFKLSKKLDNKLAKYLRDFSKTRHYRRNLIGYGLEGEFYIDTKDVFFKFWRLACNVETIEELNKYCIIDYNKPPLTQPGIWCQWVPSQNKKEIIWDGNEKFYHGHKWMQYIINNFLLPNGYSIIDGETLVFDESIYCMPDEFEDQDDEWKTDTDYFYNAKMIIKDNIVSMKYRT